jgi:hypothetical protein
LTLKVITHYGEFTGYTVKNFSKLIGKDIIVAHQLLKNDIDQHEYWLVTESLIKGIPSSGIPAWMQWKNSIKQTETGTIPFQYALLSALRSTVSAEVIPPPDLSGKMKVLSLSQEYKTDIITLFHATGSFQYRHQWLEGVVKVEELSHFLPRVGMRARSILKNGTINTYAASYRYTPERIEFTETDDLRKNVTYYLLEKVRTGVTRFTLEYYVPGGTINWLRNLLGRKKKMNDTYKKSMENLHGLVKELYVPSHV